MLERVSDPFLSKGKKMQYRTNPKNGDKLSALGYGCMRFTRNGPQIDQEKANSELKRALDLGVNYFDTAYVYPGCEVALGNFIKEYDCRDRLKIATKLPQYKITKHEDIDRYFDEELARLQTDHVDYYLLHMLNDVNSFNRLCSLGILEWIDEKKKSGAIINIGFSFHGGTKAFIDLVDAYNWDFCQIQFNYMDEHAQAGIEGLKYANKKGLPVIIMEPLRGGRLVNALPEKAINEFNSMPQKRSPADWGLRWIWNHPEVTVILSGMNDMAQVDENCRIASEAEAGMMSDTDHAFVQQLKQAIQSGVKIGCTECRYCMPCPRGVDIPGVFRCYNRMWTESKIAGRQEYTQTIAMRKQPGIPSQCVACGKCESHCPQHLPIIRLLKEAERKLTPLPYRVGLAVARRFLMRGTE